MKLSLIAATLGLFFTVSAATNAWAQAGIQIDNRGDPSPPVDLCNLGQSCAGVSLGLTVNGVDRVYVYREGVVGFGAQLSGSIAGGLESLTGGDYFAPTFGTAITGATITEMNISYVGKGPGYVLINLSGLGSAGTLGGAQFLLTNNAYLQSVTQVNFTNQPPRETDFVHDLSGNNTVTMGLRYGLQGCSTANCLLFGPTSEAGFKVGSTVVNYGAGIYPPGSQITLPLGAAVPEPGSWALMILGFASVGSMVRRRSKAAV